MDRKNHGTPDATKAGDAYKATLKNDTYTFFAASLHEDIHRQIMGGPSPPTDLGELQLASRNMELEHCKNSKLISNIKEDTQEIP